MAIAPKKPKELEKLLEQDPKLRKQLHGIVHRADVRLEKEVLETLREALQRQQIDIRLMSHNDVTDALNRFYRSISLSGEFIKMY